MSNTLIPRIQPNTNVTLLGNSHESSVQSEHGLAWEHLLANCSMEHNVSRYHASEYSLYITVYI